MNITIEHEANCKARIRTDVPPDRVQKERGGLIRQFSARARIPGFRPGKAPKQVIEKKFGKEIQDGLLENLANEALQKAMEDDELQVLEVGAIEETVFGADESLTFSLPITTAPSFDLPEYKGIAIRAPKLEVKDEQIDSTIEDLRQRFADFADFEDIEGGKLEMGDYAVLDFEGFLEGEPLAEVAEEAGSYLASGKEQWIRLDEEGFLPGFCEGLVDAKLGDKPEVTVALGEDFQVEKLAGQVLTYQVEVKGHKKQVIPEMDDELAGKIKEEATVETLREDIREGIEADTQQNVHNHKVNEVVRHLTETLEFDLPEDILMAETQQRVNEIAENAQQRGASEEELVANQEAIIGHASQQAQFNVRSAFILEQIAGKEEIKVSDEELSMAVFQVAQKEGVSPKKAIKEMQKSGQIRRIQHDLKIQKTIDFLVEHAEVEEVPQDVWEKEMAELQAEQEAQEAAAQEAAAKAAAVVTEEAEAEEAAEPEAAEEDSEKS